MPEIPVSLLSWKSIPKNSLRGFAEVRIGKSLIVSDVSVHCNAGRRWASLPSKPQMGRDGVALKDEGGKIKYVPIIRWSSKEMADAFSEGVIAAVEREHPGETASDYAP